DAIDNIGSSIDAGYSTKGAYSDLKETNKQETKPQSQKPEDAYYIRKDKKTGNSIYLNKDFYNKDGSRKKTE
ncbi:hypothetical protein BWK59_14840, partial [Flavobacterium davisii]